MRARSPPTTCIASASTGVTAVSSCSARGAGVGALLVEACIAEARHAGLELLTLTVTAENASAVRLYERHGFAPYGTLRHALKVAGRYHDKLHMVRVL